MIHGKELKAKYGRSYQTKENNDKTTLEVEYLRVYQEDGKRDIITPETEAFNNGNHFGY